MQTPKFMIEPLRKGLMEGPQAIAKILFRIQAPSKEEGCLDPRPPLHLAIVLDRSGSMSGDPLREAISCAQAIVRRLMPQDRVAVVVYDDQAKVLVPCGPVSDPEQICGLLAQVRPGGNTNLQAGWELGVGELRKANVPGAVRQVLLLSDGRANRGVVEPTALAEGCAKAHAIGIGTSTYGLGRNFEESLMTGMAVQGRGRAYYGEDSEALMGLFLEEFELLEDLFAPDLVLHLEPEAGIDIRIRNPYPPVGVSGWALPGLPYDGEAWALAYVRVSGESLANRNADGLVPLLKASVEWKDRKGTRRALEGESFALPVVCEEAYAKLPDSPLVQQRRRDLKVAEIQDAIYRKGLEGEWEEVSRLLDELRLLAGEDAYLLEVAGNLRSLAEKKKDRMNLAKSAHYFSQISSSGFRLKEPDNGSAWSNEAERKPYFRPKRQFGKEEPPQEP